MWGSWAHRHDKLSMHTGEQVRYLFEGVCRDITEELTFGRESEEVRKQVTFQVRQWGSRVPSKQRPEARRLGADEAGKVCWDLIVKILCFTWGNLCLIPRQLKVEGVHPFHFSQAKLSDSRSVFLCLWHVRSRPVLPATRLLLALVQLSAVEVIFSWGLAIWVPREGALLNPPFTSFTDLTRDGQGSLHGDSLAEINEFRIRITLIPRIFTCGQMQHVYACLSKFYFD